MWAQGPDYSFLFEHLTIDQGLSHSTVHAVLEDRSGFIWIGTRFGLNRYDGYDCKVFLPADPQTNGLGGHAIFSLLEDDRGEIWIGHQDRGISIYSPLEDRFRRFPADQFPSIDWETISVRSLFQDRRGQIWIGTYGAGVLVLDRERQPLMHLCSYCESNQHRLQNDFVFDFAEDQRGNVWIGTAGRGVALYDLSGDSVRTLEGREEDRIEGFGRELCLDHQGNLWVGTAGNGLIQVELPSEKFGQRIHASSGIGLSHDMITDLVVDKAGDLWVATDGGGLSRYQEASGTWSQYHYSANHPGTLNTEALYDLMLDRHGNLWVGTFNGGVNLHHGEEASFFSDREYIQERLAGLRSVLAMAEDAPGEVWMGTDGAGLFRWESRSQAASVKPFDRRGPVPVPDVITSIATTPGGLWLGTYGDGLYYVDPESGGQRHYLHQEDSPGSLSHNNVWDLAVDESGGLWVGTLGGGLNYLPPGSSRFERFEHMHPGDDIRLSGVQILDILLDEDAGQLWVATENAGLNCINLRTLAVGQFHHSKDDPGSLSSDRLRCLYKDEQGMLWVGTEYAGLNRLNPETGQIQRFSQQDGLPSDMINSMVEDADGHLWVSTQAGITRWDRAANRFVNVGTDPFLNNQQFNPKSVLRLADGRLIFGSTNSYSMVLPGQVSEADSAPRVLLSDLYLSNQLISVEPFEGRSILDGPLNAPGTTIHLSYRDRGIQFLLTTAHIAQASQFRYAYRLKHYEARWHSLSPGERTVNFSGLPGGEYVLELRAVGPEGMEGPVSRIAVVVDPPFWQTNWFLALCMLGGLLIITAVVSYLLQRQRAAYVALSMQAEQEILRLRNESLTKDIANQRAKLSASVLQIAHKNEFLNDLKAQLKSAGEGKLLASGLRKVIREIDRELKQEDYWQKFQLVFDQTYTEFTSQLEARHPDLTDHEKRLCCFIRMQLSNREVASILNITINGVEQAKYRIKKKLDLEKDVSLNDYIRSM